MTLVTEIPGLYVESVAWGTNRDLKAKWRSRGAVEHNWLVEHSGDGGDWDLVSGSAEAPAEVDSESSWGRRPDWIKDSLRPAGKPV